MFTIQGQSNLEKHSLCRLNSVLKTFRIISAFFIVSNQSQKDKRALYFNITTFSAASNFFNASSSCLHKKIV